MKLLQNQVDSLQEKVIDLENQLTNTEYPIRSQNKAPDDTKIIQRGNYTLKPNMGSYLQENDERVNFEVREVQNVDSDLLSEVSKSPLKTAERSEKYNIPSNQKKAQNEHNFITLSKISEEEKIEIIQTGFRLNQEGKISLKKYYESTAEYSLFQLKGYSIKYESIRRTKLYQNLKE